MSNGLTFETVARTFLHTYMLCLVLSSVKYCPAKFTETRYFRDTNY